MYSTYDDCNNDDRMRAHPSVSYRSHVPFGTDETRPLRIGTVASPAPPAPAPVTVAACATTIYLDRMHAGQAAARCVIAANEEEIQAKMAQLEEADKARIIEEEARRRLNAKRSQEEYAVRSARAEAAAEAKRVQDEAAAAAAKAKREQEAVERAEKEARDATIALAAHEVRRKDSFNQWIVGGYDGSRLPYGWAAAQLEEAFWCHIETKGCFKVCPTCGKTPTVNRLAQRERTFLENKPVADYRAGLTYVPHSSSGDFATGASPFSGVPYVAESISCCHHLFDMKSKQRFVTVESMTHPPPEHERRRFVVQIGGRYWSYEYPKGWWDKGVFINPPSDYMATPESRGWRTLSYARYDPLDPTGSIAAEAAKEAARLAKIAELEAELAKLRGV